MTSRRAKPEVCVIVALGSASPAQLRRTLDSLAAQTPLERGCQIVLTGGDLPPGFEENLPIRVLPNPAAPLAAKRAAVELVDSDFVLFLNAGDQLNTGFLKTCATSLAGTPKAGWVAPTKLDSGPWQRELDPTSEASPFNPTLCPGSLYRRDEWLRASAKHLRTLPGVPSYDEWHVQLVLLSQRRYQLPVPAAEYRCAWEQLPVSQARAKQHLLGLYLVLHSNLPRLPLVPLALGRARQVQQGGAELRPGGPTRPLERLSAAALQASGNGDIEANLGPRLTLLALASPPRFAAEFLDPTKALTLAELRCHFVTKPKLDLPAPPAIAAPAPRTILFGHGQRTIGGSEEVLQRWLRGAARLAPIRIIELAERSDFPNPNIGPEFSKLATSVSQAFTHPADESYSVDLLGTNPQSRLAACWELICRSRPQVIVISCNAYLYTLLPAIKRHFPQTVVVDLLHNEWPNQRDWFNVGHEYTEHLDRRVVITDHWRDVLVSKFGADPGRVEVVGNVVDTARFDPARFDRTHERAQLGLAEGEIALGFLGRIQHQKHPEVFLELAHRLARYPQFRLFLMGDGPQRAELMSAPLAPNLTWLGPSQAIPQFLLAMDAVIFTSRFEGFPLTSLEAGAMGTPVIAPDIVGFREQLASGDLGLSYPPSGRTSENAAAIAQIVLNQFDELRHCAARTRGHVQRHHALAEPDVAIQELLQDWLSTAADQPH